MPKGINEVKTPEALRTQFAIKGGLPGMSVDEVIVPVAIVAELAAPAERSIEQRTWGRAVSATVVAQRPAVGIFNPPDSGKLITLHDLEAWTSSDGTMGLRLYDWTTMFGTGFWTQGLMHNRDSRLGGTNFGPPYPSAQVWHATLAVQPGVEVYNMSGLANISLRRNVEYVLVPDTGLVVTRNATNVSINASFLASERPLSDSQN